MSVTQSFDVFFDVRLGKRLSKQRWWFETPWRRLWRNCNAWYWMCRITVPLSSPNRSFNYLYHLILQKSLKKTIFYVSWKEIRTRKGESQLTCLPISRRRWSWRGGRRNRVEGIAVYILGPVTCLYMLVVEQTLWTCFQIYGPLAELHVDTLDVLIAPGRVRVETVCIPRTSHWKLNIQLKPL